MTFAVENGTFAYPHADDVLRDISFSIKGGEILAILGSNGAGKTTMLRCMLGFLRWKEGRSLLDGTDISHMSSRELWRRVSYVPQSRDYTFPGSVLDLVIMGRSAHIGAISQPSDEDRKIARCALDKLSILSLSDKKASQISGGELQLVLIAKALAGGPEVLVLDEPESNLDFRNQLRVLSVISDLAREGILCIFNTHYPEHALRYATHALLMEKNGSALFGVGQRVITEANLAKAFGVKTHIGQAETDTRQIPSVIPLEIADVTECDWEDCNGNEKCLASSTIILRERESANEVNAVLHAYSSFIVGRMGMPYPVRDESIITVVLDAPRTQLFLLTQRLSQIPGLSIKTTYAKEDSYAE